MNHVAQVLVKIDKSKIIKLTGSHCLNVWLVMLLNRLICTVYCTCSVCSGLCFKIGFTQIGGTETPNLMLQDKVLADEYYF